MTKKEQGKKMGQIIVKAWADEAFKQRLLADATTVLKEEGVSVPEGMTVKAVENTDTVFHLVLPPQRDSVAGALDDDTLLLVAGGFGFCFDRTLRCVRCDTVEVTTGKS